MIKVVNVDRTLGALAAHYRCTSIMIVLVGTAEASTELRVLHPDDGVKTIGAGESFEASILNAVETVRAAELERATYAVETAERAKERSQAMDELLIELYQGKAEEEPPPDLQCLEDSASCDCFWHENLKRAEELSHAEVSALPVVQAMRKRYEPPSVKRGGYLVQPPAEGRGSVRVDGEVFGFQMEGAERGSCAHCGKPVLCHDGSKSLAHVEPTCSAFYDACERFETFEEARKENYTPPAKGVLS